MTLGTEVTQSERFRSLVAAQGPFVSVYLDDSRDAPDAEDQIAARWGDIRRQLRDAGADEGIVAVVEATVLHGEPGTGPQGRGIVATSAGVLINEHLRHPPESTIVRLSDYPYILPLVGLEILRPTYVFASVDHLGADITLHQGYGVTAESVDGGGFPVHKPGTAGWKGYGDVEHSAEEAVRMNVRAVANRLTELVDRTAAQVVFVCGEVRSRNDVVSALPGRVGGRVKQLHAGARGHRVREDDVRNVIDDAFEQRTQTMTGAVVARFTTEIGRHSGLAAEGLECVCAELREGAVETLIVGDLKDATVVTGADRTTVAPDADALSELGEAVSRVVRADEALPFAAISIGASVVPVNGNIAAADGVAALLRYVPTE
jgi:hypothetical protein